MFYQGSKPLFFFFLSFCSFKGIPNLPAILIIICSKLFFFSPLHLSTKGKLRVESREGGEGHLFQSGFFFSNGYLIR